MLNAERGKNLLNHPDVHLPWSQWSEDQTLHVATAYSNPFRWRTRRELANDFRRHMTSTSNVALHVGELAYGARPHEIVGGYPGDVPLRTQAELFHKENILNAVIRTFPSDWKYGAWVDADFHFTRHDWALEAIHQLQLYDFVQLFSSYADMSGETLGSGHLPLRVTPSFAFNYVQNGYNLPDGFINGGWRSATTAAAPDEYYGGVQAIGPGARRGVGATGGAWAFRRSAFDAVGGMLDKCILGHGDWFMTFGLVGEEAPDMHIDGYTPDYRNAILSWQRNAARLKKNIGYVDGFAVHHWHGSKMRRGYASRDTILVKYKFAPSDDLKADWQGIWQLNNDKPALRDAIRQYFISRNEDDPNCYGSERPMV
jgi:hypothetical protein